MVGLLPVNLPVLLPGGHGGTSRVRHTKGRDGTYMIFGPEAVQAHEKLYEERAKIIPLGSFAGYRQPP